MFQLPENLPLDKVKRNIANNLNFDGNERARAKWFGYFTMPINEAIIADMFW